MIPKKKRKKIPQAFGIKEQLNYFVFITTKCFEQVDIQSI
jgi:hypothetical protein